MTKVSIWKILLRSFVLVRTTCVFLNKFWINLWIIGPPICICWIMWMLQMVELPWTVLRLGQSGTMLTDPSLLLGMLGEGCLMRGELMTETIVGMLVSIWVFLKALWRRLLPILVSTLRRSALNPITDLTRAFCLTRIFVDQVLYIGTVALQIFCVRVIWMLSSHKFFVFYDSFFDSKLIFGYIRYRFARWCLGGLWPRLSCCFSLI